jgi:hypothetical protein
MVITNLKEQPRSSYEVDRAKSIPKNRANIGKVKYNLSVSD